MHDELGKEKQKLEVTWVMDSIQHSALSNQSVGFLASRASRQDVLVNGNWQSTFQIPLQKVLVVAFKCRGVKNTRMWRFIRRHKVISAVIVIVFAHVLFVWAWDLSAAVRGRFDARRDLREGKYQQLGYGLPSASRPEYVRCLRERYNVEFRAVAGCIVSRPLMDYVHAYDGVVKDILKQKFGRDIFKECGDEAYEKWHREDKAKSARR